MPQQMDREPDSVPGSEEGSPRGDSFPSGGPSASASDSDDRGTPRTGLGCHISGCERALTCPYDRRCKVCQFHRIAAEVVISGEALRFCHKCGRFEALDLFDSTRRSCRRQLEEHNRQQRRRRQATQEARRRHVPPGPPAKRPAFAAAVQAPVQMQAPPQAAHSRTVVTPGLTVAPAAASFDTLLPDMAAAMTTPEFQVLKPLLDQLDVQQLLDPALWSLVVQFLRELRGDGGDGGGAVPPPGA